MIWALEEYLYGNGVSVIEWATFIEEELPDAYLTIQLVPTGNFMKTGKSHLSRPANAMMLWSKHYREYSRKKDNNMRKRKSRNHDPGSHSGRCKDIIAFSKKTGAETPYLAYEGLKVGVRSFRGTLSGRLDGERQQCHADRDDK